MVKKLLILLLILTLAACGPTTTDQRAADTSFRTGSQGVELYFNTNLPPSRMYDGQEIGIVLDVYNRGATTLPTNSEIHISGFDNTIIQEFESTIATRRGEKSFDISGLEGKTQFNPEGGYDSAQFTGDVMSLKTRGIDVYRPTFLATACYEYETVASPTVCIDPDPFSPTAEERICIPQSVSAGSQGAPVAVTSVDVNARKGVTQFKIYIQNVGTGTLFKKGHQYLNRCDPYSGEALDYNDIDFVRVEEVKLGSDTLSCRPLDNQGYLRLNNGQGFILCETGTLSGPVYSTPLTVRLGYGYRTSTTRTVEIVQTP